MGIPLVALSSQPPQQPDLMGGVGKLLAIKSMLGQQQMQQQEIAVKQQQRADLEATTTAMKSWDRKDYEALSKSVLDNGGSAAAATAIQQHGLTLKKTVSDIAAQDATTGSKNLETFIGKHKAIGDALEGIEQVPDEQLHDAVLGKISDLAKAGIFDPQAAQGLAQQVQSTQDPKMLRMLIDQAAKSSEGAKYAADQAKTKAETAKDTEQGNEAAQAAAVSKQKALWYQQHPQVGAPGVPAEDVSAADWLSKPENKGKTFSDYTIAMKKVVPAYNFNLQNNSGAGKPSADVAKQFGMTPEAFDQAAEKYYQTGTMPSLGRGTSGPALQKAIMNRTGELHPGAVLAEQSAEFAANKDSLKKLQGNLDSVSAFESTALKNLQLFRTQAQKVIDTGIPLLNAPLRSAAKMLGSQDQAGFETSLQVANNEIAKVTSSPGLSGVLSDSARKEVENYNPKNATIGQAMHVADILEQDMANRHKSYQDQINDIKGRMGGKMGGNANQPPAGSKFSVPLPNGKTATFPDQASLDRFKAEAKLP